MRPRKALFLLGMILVGCLAFLGFVIGKVKINPKKKWVIPVTIACESMLVVITGFWMTGFWKEE
ncbi:MAG: hypothetical protein HY399_01360 [Elusimicrobia bacterium]|nr:hypothetical protein [Elusimicrobiota bacterium]